ncbi:RnfABCDGE type electron transport complex subunit D [Gordonia soli]|uniref:FAD-binding FR-type domain-containing protein n=1 Tax=Gordonia soli NBRC 108243 TaxID=1223545 RepID=M0QI79_9ACTN|nr:RnfABCDGE type electron transport complex subunit D [Gordonia soli]GAC68253.1 hypothetical protein GS4_14_00840 [Gordonia soli NBRC 108243]
MTRLTPPWLTAHRAVLLALIALVGCALVASAADGDFAYRPGQLVASLVIAIAVSGVVSYACAALVRVPPGSDSWLITALILFFILPGVIDAGSALTVAVGAGVAAASKYVLAWRRRLVINPAVAGSVVVYALAYAEVGQIGYPQWWVAAEPLLIPMLVIGVLLVSAIAEWPLVAIFLVASLATIGVVQLARGDQTLSVWLISSPMFFVAAVMLPEPLTSPTTRVHRLIYGILVGVLMYWQVAIPVTDSFTIEFVPELALLVGSLYAAGVRFVAGHGRRVPLTVDAVTPIAANTFAVVGRPDRPVRFRGGQWALLSAPRWSAPVWQSTRRVFSFSSADRDTAVEFGFTTARPASPFKSHLIDGRDQILRIDSVGGNFVLPRRGGDVVLIASGIGITPFRSMLRAAVDDGGGADAPVPDGGMLSRVTLVHVLRADDRAVYPEDLAAAEAAGAQVITLVSPTLADGLDDLDRLRSLITTVPGAHYYVSGPPGFVGVTARSLRRVDPSVWRAPWRLHTDSFRGY